MTDLSPFSADGKRDALRARIEAAERRNAERTVAVQAREAASAAVDYTRAHPLTVLVSFVAAPVASLNPFIGVGLIAGIVEAGLRRPHVSDFERLNDDIATMAGIWRNRVTHVLVVFFVSSLGGAIGNLVGGIPIFASLFG
mgnify:CR=1 FL=1